MSQNEAEISFKTQVLAACGGGSHGGDGNDLWDKLPRDLQLQVFERIRLPLKELASLRLVSKFFHSLLSSDPCYASLCHPGLQTKFILHSLLVNQSPSATSPVNSLYFLHDLHDDEIRKTFKWRPPLKGPPLLSLAASNDGFLCFVGHRKSNLPRVYAYNPTAQNGLKILTVPEGGPVVFPDCLIGIAFDRKLGACKIVLSGATSKEMTRTLIYDAKDDTWRKISDLDDVFVPRMKEPFVLEGHFYWVVRSERRECEVVLSFDVEKERWEQPLVLDDQCFMPLCMAELEKEACVISLDKECSQKLKLWKLDIHGKRTPTCVRTVTAPFCLEYSKNVSIFGRGGLLYLSTVGRFWVYGIEDRVWTNVGHFHKRWNYDVNHRCTIYEPSLLRFEGDRLAGNRKVKNKKPRLCL